jgi:hypothetical protein
VSKSASGSPIAFETASNSVSKAAVSADAFHHIAEHILLGIEMRLLRQIADRDAVRRPGLAVNVLVEAGHDLEQGRLAGAVMAEHADLRARQERQPDILQDLPAARDRSCPGPS